MDVRFVLVMYAEILSFLTHERGVCMIYSDEKDYVMRMIKEMARVISVSYTHLDVYKRQRIL